MAPGAGVEPASYLDSKSSRPYRQSNPGLPESAYGVRCSPATTIPDHHPSTWRYTSAPCLTLITRQPPQEVPVFFRTVLGLCFLMVVLANAVWSAPTRLAQNRSALSTSALSWITPGAVLPPEGGRGPGGG